MKFRVIPLTIVFALLLMLLKLMAVFSGGEALSQAMAEEKAKEEAKPETKPEEKKAETKEEKKEENEHKKEEVKEGKPAEEHGEEHGGGEEHGEKDKEPKNPAVSDTFKRDDDGRHFSAVELDLLQNLAKRREELETWENNIQIKEAALDATEKRINDKIQQIEDMRTKVSELLAQYNEKEDAKIKSLVKIYEAMKPQDAARIFDELEMPVLLMVVDKMAEKKAAPILASMNAKKAKQVTVDLAAARRVNSDALAKGAPLPAAGAN